MRERRAVYRVLAGKPEGKRLLGRPRRRWEVHIARMVERRGVYRVLVGKPEGKRLLGRPRRRWEGYIKMDLQEVGSGGID